MASSKLATLMLDVCQMMRQNCINPSPHKQSGTYHGELFHGWAPGYPEIWRSIAAPIFPHIFSHCILNKQAWASLFHSEYHCCDQYVSLNLICKIDIRKFRLVKMTCCSDSIFQLSISIYVLELEKKS